ncbi:MAG: hypothetical protein IPI67_40145 [Myxococcales bacterium]|nr:hypothetical protein [Myxococcales bacterium]
MRRAVGLLFLLASACQDPVHSAKVDALGPEPGPDGPGPFHRPGQPCTVCHGGLGPGKPEFELAGTVFESPDSVTGVDGVRVFLMDKHGNTDSLWSNWVGNFFATAGELTVQRPFWVRLESGDHTIEMKTPVERATACAECHSDPASQSSAGHVYLYEAAP